MKTKSKNRFVTHWAKPQNRRKQNIVSDMRTNKWQLEKNRKTKKRHKRNEKISQVMLIKSIVYQFLFTSRSIWLSLFLLLTLRPLIFSLRNCLPQSMDFLILHVKNTWFSVCLTIQIHLFDRHNQNGVVDCRFLSLSGSVSFNLTPLRLKIKFDWMEQFIANQ